MKYIGALLIVMTEVRSGTVVLTAVMVKGTAVVVMGAVAVEMVEVAEVATVL